MPFCEEALRRRQHAEIAEGIHRQRRRLAERSIRRAPGKEGNLTAERRTRKWRNGKRNQTALLLDPDGKAGQTYGAKNTPHMFISIPKAKLIYEGAIDSKAIAESG